MPKVIHIADIAREERKRIDWRRTHIEGDMRRPIHLADNRGGRWLSPISRRRSNVVER
jgi:hypothetical protein